MPTITTEQQNAIAAKIETMVLPKGIGDEHSACSIAAINLALTGKLTDEIPECMSLVIGKWIIGVQDAMPAEMRNRLEWKRLLPLAAGTGRDKAAEARRVALIPDWIWAVVLPEIQSIADNYGFGDAWRKMCNLRTADAARAAARAAANAATNAARAAANAATNAAYAADAARAAADAAAYAAYAADAADAADAAYAAADAADAAYAAARAAADAAAYAAYAADAADAADAAYAAADAAAWNKFNPCQLLAQLIEV